TLPLLGRKVEDRHFLREASLHLEQEEARKPPPFWEVTAASRDGKLTYDLIVVQLAVLVEIVHDPNAQSVVRRKVRRAIANLGGYGFRPAIARARHGHVPHQLVACQRRELRLSGLRLHGADVSRAASEEVPLDADPQ